MSRYSKGETSTAKLQEKQTKSQSLLNKTLLIRKAVEELQRLPSLDTLISNRGISFKAALAWTDANLGVVSCSYNTSRQHYNIEYSYQLSTVLKKYNKLTNAVDCPPQKQNAQRSQHEEISTLKKQIDSLTNTIAEIYRAYMQLTARVDEQTRQDLRYQQVLKSHTQTLDKAHLTLVKP
jgi:esterase/lipase